MSLKQTEIPNSVDVEKLEKGWRDQIFIPMSKILGYPIEDWLKPISKKNFDKNWSKSTVT